MRTQSSRPPHATGAFDATEEARRRAYQDSTVFLAKTAAFFDLANCASSSATLTATRARHSLREPVRNRVLQFLLLLLVAIQSPALRSCGVATMLFDSSCHDSPSASLANLVHCDELAFATTPSENDGRDACASCEVKPSGLDQSDRAALPTIDVPLLQPPVLTLAIATDRFRPSLRPPAASSALSERVLPLLL